jgi:hypothetical protein
MFIDVTLPALELDVHRRDPSAVTASDERGQLTPRNPNTLLPKRSRVINSTSTCLKALRALPSQEGAWTTPGAAKVSGARPPALQVRQFVPLWTIL